MRERNGWFQILSRYQGKQFTHALKTPEFREAEAMRGTVERVLFRINHQEIPPVPEGVDVADYLLNGGKVPELPKAVEKALTQKDLAERYETAHGGGAIEANSLATARMHLQHFIDSLGEGFTIRDHSTQDLQGYLDKRGRRKGPKHRRISPTTLKKEVASRRVVWYWAVRSGLLKGTFPGRSLTHPKTDEKPPFWTPEEIERQIAIGASPAEKRMLWHSVYLTLGEIDELLAYAKNAVIRLFVYPIFLSAAHTGARRSEMLRLG